MCSGNGPIRPQTKQDKSSLWLVPPGGYLLNLNRIISAYIKGKRKISLMEKELIDYTNVSKGQWKIGLLLNQSFLKSRFPLISSLEY